MGVGPFSVAVDSPYMPVLSDPHGTQPLHLYRRIMWGWPEPSQGQPITDGAMIESGDRRGTMDTLASIARVLKIDLDDLAQGEAD